MNWSPSISKVKLQSADTQTHIFLTDDDEDILAPMEADDDEDMEGKGEKTEKELKEEKKEEGEKEEETPMEQQAEEDDVDPLDAYMEEVKQEVKKFNMGGVKGNDKVSVRLRNDIKDNKWIQLTDEKW